MNRRWALPLFLASMAVFWGGLGLSGALFPERGDDRVYAWSAQDAAEVRQVVVELPNADWLSVELTWSASEPPQLKSNESAYAVPWLVLVREGDTLYVRPNPERQREGQTALYRRGGGLELRLPMQVTQVSAPALNIVSGPVPPQLTLAGGLVRVNGNGLHNDIAALRVMGLVRCEPSGPQQRSDLTVSASRVQALQVEVVHGKLSLSDFSHLAQVALHGPADTALEVDSVGDLAKLQWTELSAEREATLREASTRVAAMSAETACQTSSPRIRMKTR